MQASYAILNDYSPVRAAAGHDTPFALRVIDTQNAVRRAGRHRGGGRAPARRRRRRAEDPRAPGEPGAAHPRVTWSRRDLLLPAQPRAQRKGDRSVGLLSAALGTALDIKPVLHCNRGETAPVAKVKGFDTAVQKLFSCRQRRSRRRGLMTPTHVPELRRRTGRDARPARLRRPARDLRRATTSNCSKA